MAEILKRGVLPKDKTFDLTCRKCNSEIRFKGSEAASSITDPRDGKRTLFFKCPVCDNQIAGAA